MTSRLKTLVSLVDPDPVRRAAVAKSLAPIAEDVDSLGQLDKLFASWPPHGIIVIADCASLVAQLQAAMRTTKESRTHVVFGEAPTPGAVVDAMIGGATDYLAWPSTPREISARATAWPMRGANKSRRAELRKLAQRRLAKLTKREIQVLQLMAEGLTSDEIATSLHLGIKTIGSHRYRMFKELEVDGLAKAVRVLIEANF